MKPKVAGIVIILINACWMLYFFQYLYWYQDTSINRFYTHPYWYLAMNLAFGFIGLVIGIKVYQEKLRVLTGFLSTFILMSMSFIIDIMRNL